MNTVIINDWSYKGKYDAEIRALVIRKGYGARRIYKALLEAHNGKVDISLSTVTTRVREIKAGLR